MWQYIFYCCPFQLQQPQTYTFQIIETYHCNQYNAPSDCSDESGWQLILGEDTIAGCEVVSGIDTNGDYFELYDFWKNNPPYNGRTVLEACCACGGGTHVTNSPTQFASVSASLF